MSPTSNLFFGYVPCFGIDIFGGGVTIVFAGLVVVSFAVSLPGPKTVFTSLFFEKKYFLWASRRELLCANAGRCHGRLVGGPLSADL